MLADFPVWFEAFLKEQLKETPHFEENESYHVDTLMVSYIKLWGGYRIIFKNCLSVVRKKESFKRN